MPTIFCHREFLFAIKKSFFLFSFFIAGLSYSYGQDSREELVERYLNVSKYLIQSSNYDSAAKVLKSAFIKNAVLPDELLYYYSFVLFKKNELEQSSKFIEKFISISSPKAELFNDALELKSSIDHAIDLNSIPCEHCAGEGVHFHPCTNCNSTGEVSCEVCHGKGKVLVGGAQGMKYGVCITCMGDGKRTCKKCNGERQTSEPCVVCGGRGKIKKTSEPKP